MSEVRKLGVDDLSWGTGTWTSPAGMVVTRIPVASPTGNMFMGVYDVKAYGAVGDNVTDDTAAIQAVIDVAYAAGGGVVLLPAATYRVINLILKDGVVLYGSPGGYGYQVSSIERTVLRAYAAGIIVDTPAGGTTGAAILGIDFQGLGAGTAVKGIRLRAGNWNQIKNVHLNNMSDEGIVISAGKADVIEDVLATNCVLDRTQAAVIGAVDIGGTDHYLNRIEATVSGSTEGTVQSVNLYHVGILIRARTIS